MSSNELASGGLTLEDVRHRANIKLEEWAEIQQVGRYVAYRMAEQGRIAGLMRFGRFYRVSVPAMLRALGETVVAEHPQPKRLDIQGSYAGPVIVGPDPVR